MMSSGASSAWLIVQVRVLVRVRSGVLRRSFSIRYPYDSMLTVRSFSRRLSS